METVSAAAAVAGIGARGTADARRSVERTRESVGRRGESGSIGRRGRVGWKLSSEEKAEIRDKVSISDGQTSPGMWTRYLLSNVYVRNMFLKPCFSRGVLHFSTILSLR